jgi:hypothetical protein
MIQHSRDGGCTRICGSTPIWKYSPYRVGPTYGVQPPYRGTPQGVGTSADGGDPQYWGILPHEGTHRNNGILPWSGVWLGWEGWAGVGHGEGNHNEAMDDDKQAH